MSHATLVAAVEQTLMSASVFNIVLRECEARKKHNGSPSLRKFGQIELGRDSSSSTQYLVGTNAGFLGVMGKNLARN